MKPRKIQWLAGWYASVLHAYDGPGTTNPSQELQAVCGNGVFLKPRTEEVAWKLAKGNVPRCKKCERIVASMAQQTTADGDPVEQIHAALAKAEIKGPVMMTKGNR